MDRTVTIDGKTYLDPDDADRLVDMVLLELGRTRKDFYRGKIKSREWDRAHMALTGETLTEIRAWQAKWRATKRMFAQGGENYVDWDQCFEGSPRWHIEDVCAVTFVITLVAIPVGGLLVAGILLGKYVL